MLQLASGPAPSYTPHRAHLKHDASQTPSYQNASAPRALLCQAGSAVTALHPERTPVAPAYCTSSVNSPGLEPYARHAPETRVRYAPLVLSEGRTCSCANMARHRTSMPHPETTHVFYLQLRLLETFPLSRCWRNQPRARGTEEKARSALQRDGSGKCFRKQLQSHTSGFFSLCYQILLRTEGEEPEAQCSCSLKWIRWSQDTPCK